MQQEPDELTTLKRKVARFPTDLQARFDLGAALHARGDYREAITNLLAAQNSPHVRVQAMRLLIAAFEEIGRPDRAALIREQLSRERGGEGGESSAPAPA